MSGLRSRSTALKNTVSWRHESFFADYPDFEGDLEQYAGTERDSVWRFRKGRTNADADIVTLELRRRLRAMNKALAEADPESPAATVLDLEPSLGQRLSLAQLTVSVEGPFFMVPADFTVGDVDGTDNEAPHPLAGEPMPVDDAWLNLIDEPVLDAASLFLNDLYARRSSEDEATFSNEPVPVADAEQPPRRVRTRGTRPSTVS